MFEDIDLSAIHEENAKILDKRIAKTQAKKDALLLILKHPELPLYNNPAELAARFQVRKRDISFGPRTEDGRTLGIHS